MTTRVSALSAEAEFRRLVQSNLRSETSALKVGVIVALTVIPCVLGCFEATGGVFRDDLDILALIVTSPLQLVFPLVVCVAANTRFAAELGHRFVAATRTRAPIERYLGAKVASSAILGAASGSLFALLPCILAFGVWPLLGNPSVDPGVYGLTTGEAVRDAGNRFSFTELIPISTLLYALVYSAWVAFAGAMYGAMGVLTLSLAKNRLLGFSAPFLIFIAQSVLVALVGDVRFALVFSLFPFGLDQATLIPLLTQAGLAAGLVIVGVFVLRRSSTLPRFA